MNRTVVFVAPMFAAMSWGAHARADEPPAPRDPAGAETLFNSAVALLKQGDWVEACRKFDASMGLDPSVSTLLKIARCHEHDGRLATAWYDYQHAIKLNAQLPSPTEARRAELDDVAKQGLSAIEPRVPHLRVLAPDLPADLTVEVHRDGVVVPLSALGEALPIDPGTHVVRLDATGYEPDEVSVDIVEGETKDATLKLGAPRPSAPLPSIAPAAIEPSKAAPADARARPDTHNALGGVRIAGIAVGGSGLVALGVSAGFGLATLVSVNRAGQYCDAKWVCRAQAGLDLLDEAKRTQTLAFSMLGVGGALAGAGALMVALGPDASPTKPEVKVGVGTVSVRGAW